MTQPTQPFEQPSFEFYPTIDETSKRQLQTIEQAIIEDPDTQLAALHVMAIGTEAVGQVLDFVEDNPEGSKILRDWQALFEGRLDEELFFDDETEAALLTDDTIVRLQKDPKMDPELRRDRIRRRRFNVFANRTRKLKIAIATQNQQNPAGNHAA